VSVLRWLKREMGFYCIELMAEPQEVVFALGGCGDDEILASVMCYDVASGVWRKAAPMTEARTDLGSCVLNGALYVTGGEDGGAVLASVERYDPSLDTWSAVPALPLPRRGHCACAVGDAMYVLGGIEWIDGKERAVSTVLKFDSRTQTWSEVAPMPSGRDFAGACVVGTNIYIFGGRSSENTTTSTTYRFSTASNTWATFAPMIEAKCFHSV
jgi:N-acetylneuraminic acid mutarotase